MSITFSSLQFIRKLSSCTVPIAQLLATYIIPLLPNCTAKITGWTNCHKSSMSKANFQLLSKRSYYLPWQRFLAKRAQMETDILQSNWSFFRCINWKGKCFCNACHLIFKHETDRQMQLFYDINCQWISGFVFSPIKNKTSNGTH